MLAELTETTYGTVLESLPISVCVVTPNRLTLVGNGGAEKLTGYTRQKEIGLCCADNPLIYRDETQAVPCGGGCLLQQTTHDAKPWESRVFMRHKDGYRVPVLVCAVALLDHGSIVGAARTFDLCTSGSVPARTTLTITLTDDLTELPDCDPVVARVVACLDEFALSHVPFVVSGMTIDDLEHLRHVDGRIATDAIVRVAAETLASSIGSRDVVGRWADDRVTAIVDDCTRESLVQAAEMRKDLVCLSATPWWGGRIAPVLSAPGARVQIGDTAEKMTVRTPDANLASTLPENLPALSARLAENGFKSEAWHPAAASTNEQRHTAESAAGNASQDANPQPRQQDREPQDGAGQPRPQSPQEPISHKQKGTDFAWLISSLR